MLGHITQRGGVSLVVALFLLSSLGANAATVWVNPVETATAGLEVRVPVEFLPDARNQVSGVQLDLHVDGAALIWVEAVEGDAAEDADKQVSASVLDEDTTRILVIGFNQNVLGSGVLFEAVYQVASSTPAGTLAVDLEGVLMTNPVGLAVPGEYESGYVVVDGAAVEGEGEGSTDKPSESLACGAHDFARGESSGLDILVCLITLSMLMAFHSRGRGRNVRAGNGRGPLE